jgi:hypothetical protein
VSQTARSQPPEDVERREREREREREVNAAVRVRPGQDGWFWWRSQERSCCRQAGGVARGAACSEASGEARLGWDRRERERAMVE